MAATGHIDCSHSTTKGSVICQDCNTNVTIYPWQLRDARNEGYKKGLQDQVVTPIRIFRAGLILGVALTLVILYCVFLLI